MTIDFSGPDGQIEVMLSPENLERCINALLARADSYRSLANECRESGLRNTANGWAKAAKQHDEIAEFLKDHRHAA